MITFLKATGVFLILYAVVLLLLLFVEILAAPDRLTPLLQLVGAMLSWEVIAGLLGLGAGLRYREEIGRFLTRA